MSKLKYYLKCSAAHDRNEDFTYPKTMAIPAPVGHNHGRKYYKNECVKIRNTYCCTYQG